jgi:hypothetical protein
MRTTQHYAWPSQFKTNSAPKTNRYFFAALTGSFTASMVDNSTL